MQKKTPCIQADHAFANQYVLTMKPASVHGTNIQLTKTLSLMSTVNFLTCMFLCTCVSSLFVMFVSERMRKKLCGDFCHVIIDTLYNAHQQAGNLNFRSGGCCYMCSILTDTALQHATRTPQLNNFLFFQLQGNELGK